MLMLGSFVTASSSAERSYVPNLPADRHERRQLLKYLNGYVAKQGPREAEAFRAAASAIRGDLQYPMIIVKHGGQVQASTSNARRTAETLIRAYDVAGGVVGRADFGWSLQLVSGNVLAHVDQFSKKVNVTILAPGSDGSSGQTRTWEFERKGASVQCIKSGRFAPGWKPLRTWQRAHK